MTHHHHHHHHSHTGIRFPLRANPSIAASHRTGPAAYQRAALRWKFGASSHLTGYYAQAAAGGGHKIIRSVGEGQGDGTEVPADSISNDLEYVVDVTIGTPGVALKLDFDTGSSDLWVFSSSLPASETQNHTVYDPTKSSSAKELQGSSWNISYGDGSSASGNVYQDTVKIGSLSITSQAVELATKLSEQFVSSGSDGLLGLAWPSLNTITPTQQPTPVENLISQKGIENALFTVKLDKGDNNGFYTFGEIDTSVTTNTIEYTPVDNSQGFWQFPSTSVTINGTATARANNTAIADTGTTLVLVDDATVEAIYKAIPGSKVDNTQGGYVYPTSSTAPTVAFAVGGTMIEIPPENFAYGEATNGFYFGGVQSRGTQNFDIFGDVWLKGVYVVFDQGGKRIGVAQRTS